MPAANALATFAQLCTYFTELQASDQTFYEGLIDQASARFESYCGRPLASQTYTNKILDGTGGRDLLLPTFPVSSLSALYADSDRAFGSSSLVAAADYVLTTDSGIVSLTSTFFPCGKGTIKATFTAGYLTTDRLYPILLAALIEQVSWTAKRYKGNGIGVRSVTGADGMNTALEIDMPMNVRAMLDPFREVRL